MNIGLVPMKGTNAIVVPERHGERWAILERVRVCAGVLFRAFLIVFVSCLVAGCTAAYSRWADLESSVVIGEERRNCHEVLEEVHRFVSDTKTADVESHRIAGFPYLRINRFLASLGERLRGNSDKPQFDAWVDRLRLLDSQAVDVEVANLPRHAKFSLSRSLFGQVASRERIFEVTETCANELRRRDLADRQRRRRLIAAAHVPDSYSEVARAVGLYPLTSIPVATGWERWKKANLPTFQRPPAQLPVRGRLIEYAPSGSRSGLEAQEVAEIVARSRDSLLGIPEPSTADLVRLFHSFAPIWKVDSVGAYDEPGHPAWSVDGSSILIDRSRPTVFTRVSHTLVGDQVLLQLNYAVWFSERPPEKPFDILAGRLDGVIWRVTLGADGRPLVYDSVHACGCYHLFFPSKTLAANSDGVLASASQESPAVVAVAPQLKRQERIVLRIQSGSHYLISIFAAGRTNRGHVRRRYHFADEKTLRSLKRKGDGRRSLFDDTGLVAGSERPERLLLWPTGISSPGAMRQWGHHATAFVGRRHFDDPRLFESIFGTVRSQ